MAPITANGKQRGHMMVATLVMVTLITVVLGVVIQPMRTIATRAKEAELIYRGEHIAMGIRRYYFKYGRFPTKLDDLAEGDPRFIRQLYKDPMTKEGEWTLVYFDPTNMKQVRELNGQRSGGLSSGLQRLVGDQDQEQNSENSNIGLSGGEGSVFGINNQQIVGIRSKSEEEGFRVYQDSSIYADWLFSALPQPKNSDVESLIDQFN
jgi:hypothetical protein